MSAKSIIKKSLYYVANLGNNTIILIDGEDSSKIRTLSLPFPPFTMILYNDFIYVGGYGDKIGILDTRDNTLKYMNIESNGNIHIDEDNRRIYASNISEIGVYDISLKKKLGGIKGFSIADSIKIDNKKNRLFILDVFRKQLKIYDLKTMKFISKIENIGVRSNSILISDDGKKVYISNEGGVDEYSGNVSIIDMEKSKMSTICFPKNSSLTSLEGKGNKIYALNKGLNKIDIINIDTESVEASIDIINPKKLIINNDRLIVVSKPELDKLWVSVINTRDNSIVKNIHIDEYKGEPYSIIEISRTASLNREEETIEDKKIEAIDKSLKTQSNIIEIYNEILSFKDILIEIPESYVGPFILNRIIFNKGYIVKGTEVLSKVKGKSIRVKFKIRIPYKLKVKDGAGGLRTLKKFIEEDKVVYIESPYLYENKNIKVYLSTGNEIIHESMLIKDIVTLSIDLNMRVKFMVEPEVTTSMKKVK